MALISFVMLQTQDKKFQRQKEDFRCEQCGAAIRGDGYTNHCPKCLWSKHVDIFPGDRLAPCGGLMEPIAVLYNRRIGKMVHRCLACGYEKKNKVAKNDDFEALLALARHLANK